MGEKGIKKYCLILLIIISVYLYFNVSFQNEKDINYNFKELNIIELYVDSSIENTIRLTDKINSINSSFYSYPDNSKDLLLYNSLKSFSSDELDVYINILNKPNINELLFSFSSFLSDGEKNNDIYLNILYRALLTIREYFTTSITNSTIGVDILESIVLDEIEEKKYRGLHKVNVIFNQPVNKTDFNNIYLNFFTYLEKYKSEDFHIKYIKTYNTYIYDLLSDYGDDLNSTIALEYQDYILCYSDSLNFYKDILMDDIDVNISSINNYLTDSSLRGDKYKKIKKLYRSVNQYDPSNNKWLKYQGISNILNSLDDIALHLNKYKTSQNVLNELFLEKILEELNFVRNYIDINKNNYNVNYLISNYNENAPSFIKNISNTEPVTLNFIDPYIYQYYYNDTLNKYAVFVDCKGDDICNDLVYNYYDQDCSISQDIKIKNLNLLFLLTIVMVSLIFIINKYKKNYDS